MAERQGTDRSTAPTLWGVVRAADLLFGDVPEH